MGHTSPGTRGDTTTLAADSRNNTQGNMTKLLMMVVLMVVLVGLVAAVPWGGYRYRPSYYGGYRSYGYSAPVAYHGAGYLGGTYIAKTPGSLHIAPLYG